MPPQRKRTSAKSNSPPATKKSRRGRTDNVAVPDTITMDVTTPIRKSLRTNKSLPTTEKNQNNRKDVTKVSRDDRSKSVRRNRPVKPTDDEENDALNLRNKSVPTPKENFKDDTKVSVNRRSRSLAVRRYKAAAPAEEEDDEVNLRNKSVPTTRKNENCKDDTIVPVNRRARSVAARRNKTTTPHKEDEESHDEVKLCKNNMNEGGTTNSSRKLSTKTLNKRNLRSADLKSSPESSPEKNGVRTATKSSENCLKSSSENLANPIVSSDSDEAVDSNLEISTAAIEGQTLEDYNKLFPLLTKKRLTLTDDSQRSADTQTCTKNLLSIDQLLAIGESGAPSNDIEVTVNPASESEASDFEVVDAGENDMAGEEKLHVIVEEPALNFKRKKKQYDAQEALRLFLGRFRRDIQIWMHKTHLLSWIGHLRFVNATLNSDLIRALCLSLLPSKNLKPPKVLDTGFIDRVIKWFKSDIALKNRQGSFDFQRNYLIYQFTQATSFNKTYFLYMFIAFLRAFKAQVRLVTSVQVVPMRPKLKKTKKKVKEETSPVINNVTSTSTEHAALKASNVPTLCHVQQRRKRTFKENEIDSRVFSSSSDEEPLINHLIKAKVGKENSLSTSKLRSDGKIETLVLQKMKSKRGGRKKNITDDEFSATSDTSSEEDEDDTEVVKKRKAAKKSIKKRRNASPMSVDSDSSDDDYTPTSKSKLGTDQWLEVYVEAERKWISVDIFTGRKDCNQQLRKSATQPISYVLAINNDSTIKDVTKRYVLDWHKETRKLRIAESWWEQTLKPYLPTPSSQDREEEEAIAQKISELPLPTTISEFKSHPLYALSRHLLKFEAIYPPDAPTLGFIRNEPVYARECVVLLKSRDTWFKEARVVRPNESPYKVVKARPKYDRMSGEYKNDLPLEIFGYWQTDEYVPPTAVGGKVPRNEYGNVDLFLPCMLPKGTVHLQLPSLNRVARKLGIDCAPAIVGFEYHKRFRAHPLQDGFVASEEFKYRLANAWKKDLEISERRAEKRRTDRVFGNWRRLIRGLFIRERLINKYSFGGEEKATTSKK